jgi:hypothetical protein
VNEMDAVVMGPVQVHLQRLLARYPGTGIQDLPGTGGVITVPNIHLPQGWSKASTAVHFWAQPGYPYAKLDCFWVDPDLRLATGAMPQSSGFGNGPAVLSGHVWFSWHTDHWNPGRDDFLTWMASIRERLNKVV